MILLKEEGRPAASLTMATIIVERPEGAGKVQQGAPFWKGEIIIANCVKDHLNINSLGGSFNVKFNILTSVI